MLTSQPQISAAVELIFQSCLCSGWIILHWYFGSNGGGGGHMFGFLFSIVARTFNVRFTLFAKF